MNSLSKLRISSRYINRSHKHFSTKSSSQAFHEIYKQEIEKLQKQSYVYLFILIKIDKLLLKQNIKLRMISHQMKAISIHITLKNSLYTGQHITLEHLLLMQLVQNQFLHIMNLLYFQEEFHY